MRRVWLLSGFVVVALGLLPALGHEPTANAPGHAPAAKKGSEPPIFTPVRIDLTVWTVVVFVLLFLILRTFAWRPMLEGLHRREESILAAIEDARKARLEAEQLRMQIDQERAKVAEEVRAQIEEARRDAQRMTEEMQAKARADIQADRERLRREIETARDQALQELWNQAAQLATLISAKAIQRQLTPEDHARLIDEALAELGAARDGWRERLTT
ncbi:MAG: ATP synthase F0 subunit B [Gemmataceae bacterium]|nr:ATP synthase F0 subunit B [Gemmataceae bacterium]MDW8265123.1 ATP synthase F0 subunit B [Gemmataceae bacterium]